MSGGRRLAALLRSWLSPLVYLANNWLSLAGVVVVTTAGVLWLFLLPTTLRGQAQHPYVGILVFLLLPGGFFGGLAAIPTGIWLRRARERRRGAYPPSFPPLELGQAELRRLAAFVGVTTVINVVIGGQLTYRAVTYMDTVGFCGQTCHSVMKPEFTAYQNSPHSRVECVKCHIGPGASWFVQSKLSGVGQVFAVTFNRYPRPIPAPVASLRPARETCEACHWPQKFGGDRLRVFTKFAEDEGNTPGKTVLLMRIGGGNGGPGIHGVHLGPGVVIEYAYSDRNRQTIPWVRYHGGSGRSTLYLAPGAKPESGELLPRRVMDCMDCHNRPTHVFDLPERAVDRALAAGEIAASLPFARKTSVEILKKGYSSGAEAGDAIPAAFEGYYKDTYPALHAKRRGEITRSAQELLAIFERSVFPEMKIAWGTYPNNIGHTDFPGCFRCHDDTHASADGRRIPQDCNACHGLLAVEEPAPRILTDLGLTQ